MYLKLPVEAVSGFLFWDVSQRRFRGKKKKKQQNQCLNFQNRLRPGTPYINLFEHT
jgi:hypothetical protein